MNQQQNQSTLKATFWLVVVLIASCDSFQEDLIKKENQVTFNQTEFFILPGTSVVIDLKSLIEQFVHRCHPEATTPLT